MTFSTSYFLYSSDTYMSLPAVLVAECGGSEDTEDQKTEVRSPHSAVSRGCPWRHDGLGSGTIVIIIHYWKLDQIAGAV